MPPASPTTPAQANVAGVLQIIFWWAIFVFWGELHLIASITQTEIVDSVKVGIPFTGVCACKRMKTAEVVRIHMENALDVMKDMCS